MSKLRIKECFKCSKQKEVMYRCRYDEIKDWVFLCGACLKKLKVYLKIHTNMGALGRVTRNNFFYLEQQLTVSLQHPSLQQLLLHSPVLQPSLQQPFAQQVSLQQVSTLSICSVIIKLLLSHIILIHNCNKYTFKTNHSKLKIKN